MLENKKNEIERKISNLIKDFNGNISVCAYDSNNNIFEINDNVIVESASCIKLYILIEYYRQIMLGIKNRNDELLYNYKEDYVSNGSGVIQFLDTNAKFSSKNMAILMMILSDNIATGKMIEYLGFDNINNTIKSLGLTQTRLVAKKLDFNMYNSIGETTAFEYAKTFKMILNKEILTEKIDDEIIEILSNNQHRTMIIKNLPLEDLYGTKDNSNCFIKYIASKSGGVGDENNKITNCRNDGGIISTEYGELIISIFINHFDDYYFYNDNPAYIIGGKIISEIYNEFKNNNGNLYRDNIITENDVTLEQEENDYFREWIIEEWKHHNTVDPIYQLRIIKPEELKFEDTEKYYKIMLHNTMVGFIGIKNYDKEIYLYRFFIEEKYRNKGIGTIALNKIIDMAKKQGKDMSLEVMGENIARNLYERLGFKTHYRKMVLKINDDIYIKKIIKKY